MRMSPSGLIAAGLVIAAIGGAVPVNHAGHCREDARCWNWRTMGNHKRGVVTLAGRHKVIGPIAFDRLDNACRIDWTRSPHLTGDGPRCIVR